MKPGEKFSVVIPEELLRVVGTDAQALITEAGIIVRKYAPLQVKNWKSIGQHEKEKLWAWLQVGMMHIIILFRLRSIAFYIIGIDLEFMSV